MSTQVEHPWRATLRTAGAVTLAMVLLIPPVIGVVRDVLAEHNIAVPAQLDVILAGITVGITVATTIVQRVMLLPGVDALLTRLGIGPTPPRRSIE